MKLKRFFISASPLLHLSPQCEYVEVLWFETENFCQHR
jgi:hypothetical protein